MTTVYLLKNQHNQFLDKSGEWVDSSHAKSLFRTEYKDVAINQKVEFSVKNSDLRIVIDETQLDDHSIPLLNTLDTMKKDVTVADHSATEAVQFDVEQPSQNDEPITDGSDQTDDLAYRAER